MILLDTNLLTRITSPAHPHCVLSRTAMHKLLARRERLVIFPQCLYEFWAVATRKPGPAPTGQNGLGMTCAQASQWVNFLQRRFELLHDRPELVERWHDLVGSLGVKGVKSHDTRLVAAMQTHGVARLLTFNSDDFKMFAITILDPASI